MKTFICNAITIVAVPNVGALLAAPFMFVLPAVKGSSIGTFIYGVLSEGVGYAATMALVAWAFGKLGMTPSWLLTLSIVGVSLWINWQRISVASDKNIGLEISSACGMIAGILIGAILFF